MPPTTVQSVSYDRTRVPAYTSVGVVANHRFHKLSDFGTKAKMQSWLEKHEPVLARVLAESGESKTLYHDLHSEVGHVPTVVIHDVIEQHTQVSVDLVRTTELLIEVACEHFNVTCFVNHLGAGVQLGVVPRNSLNNFRGTDKCTLLAVHEL